MGAPNPSGGQASRTSQQEAADALLDFAQAFLSLEHAFSFYPEGHQSRTGPLERVLELMRAEAGESGEAGLALAGESLLWRASLHEEPPPAVRKLAGLLGAQGIARVSWTAGLTAGELQQFVNLLVKGRSGGRRTAWESREQSEHLRVESPDYESLMTEAGAEGEAERRRNLWKALLLRSLSGPEGDLSAEELRQLQESWLEPGTLAQLLVETIGESARSGSPESVEPMRRCAALFEQAAGAAGAATREEWAARLAEVGRQLPPGLRLRLLESAIEDDDGGLFKKAFGELAPAEGIALLGRTFAMDPAQIERLTRVFQYLIPRQLDRMELVPQLREEVRATGSPEEPLAENAWEEVQELLTGEAGDFMTDAYREQLRRLAAREEARRSGERTLADFPELAASLAPAQIAGGALRIQMEELRLATGVERFRDALDALSGLCAASFAAGDRERGMLILRRLLEIRAGDEPLAGPRSEVERSLRALASAPVLDALISFATTYLREELAAVRSLVALAPEASAPALLDRLVADENAGHRREITALLREIAPAALPDVMRRLQGASPATSRVLLALLGEVRDPAAVPVLLGLLGREDPKLRRDALRALVRIDSPEVRRALPALLADGDEEIVQTAAVHLGAVGSPETVRALIGTLDVGLFAGRRAEEARRAIFVLGRMRAAEAVAPLGELLRRRTWINRRVQEALAEAAAQALARIGGDEAKKALEQAAARGSEKVAASCRRLLARWGGG